MCISCTRPRLATPGVLIGLATDPGRIGRTSSRKSWTVLTLLKTTADQANNTLKFDLEALSETTRTRLADVDFDWPGTLDPQAIRTRHALLDP